MTHSLSPLLRRAAACLNRAFFCVGARLAVIVGIAVAVAGSAHAATPFEVRVDGSGPDVLLIPGLASSGAVWDDVARSLCRTHRCHVFTLAGFAGVPAQRGPLRMWIADKDVSTREQARAVYERPYRTLQGVQVAMSPAGRHFIMLDDPAWFDATLRAFVQ